MEENRFVPFTRPDITEADIEAVTGVLRSGWLTTGPVTARFEAALAARCQTSAAVCLSSATAGLELTLRLLGVGPGDEVVVPAYTFSATAAAVLHAGATPVLADCAPGRFHLTAEAVAPRLTARTRAVIPVDFGGVCCEYGPLKAVCHEAPSTLPTGGLWPLLGRPAVIADAAHALGATTPDGPAGSLGDFSIFSFHAAKNLTTAEGGAVTWRIPGADNADVAARLRRLALHGQTKTALEREGSVEYDIACCGYKANLTDLQAVLGLSQLGRYDAMLARRREIVARYRANLPTDWGALDHPDGSAAHLFCALLPEGEESRRDGLLAALRARGVAGNIHYRPLPLMTAYRRLGWRAEDFPNAVALYRRELSLPLSSIMTDGEVDWVLETLHEAARG